MLCNLNTSPMTCVPALDKLSAKISANMLTDTRPTDVDWHINSDTRLTCRLIFDWYVNRVSAGSTVLKNTLEVSNYHVHLYVANCLIFNFLFSFSGRRGQKRFVLKRVGAELQMFKSGSNNTVIAGVKDVIPTGKRSRVVRLVCEPSFILLMVTYWILGKDLVLEMFADTGQEVIEWGRDFAEILCC